MTKVQAIAKVMQDNGGLSNWAMIYNEIERYYPTIKKSQQWQAGIRGVLYREIKAGRNFKKLDNSLFALISYDENLLSLQSSDVSTESLTTAKIRIGQNKFREILLAKLENKCLITGINDRRLLIASHIKPWAMSTDNERLDVNNGLILSPVFDRLFDEGLITFSMEKELIISTSLSRANAKKIGIINRQKVIRLPVLGREKYLEYHNEKVFLQ